LLCFGSNFPSPILDFDGYLLASPRIKEPVIEAGLERKLAAALATRYSNLGQKAIPMKTIRKHFKTSDVQIFGRVKMKGGGDTVRAAAVCKMTATDSREASFVRVRVLFSSLFPLL
jgi:hypothetical protein